MKLLLIHTAASAEGVVALATGDGVVGAEHLPGRSSSETLIPAIRVLCGDVGWRVKDLTAVVVVIGPGSFTGVRVGLSAAKGFCEAGSVPLIALSRLALLARLAGRGGPRVMALLDAGRGEYYCGVYGEGQSSEELLRIGEVQDRAAGGSLLTCEAKVREAFGEVVRLVPEPGPGEMLAMALERMAAEQWSDVALTDANYLRRTDAELLASKAAGIRKP